MARPISVPGDEPGVGVPAHRCNSPLSNSVNHLARLRAEHGEVAEADDLIDAGAIELGQYRVEREQIPVDVGYEPDAHCGCHLDRLDAAVDVDALPCDICAVVRGQKRDNAGDGVRRAEIPERYRRALLLRRLFDRDPGSGGPSPERGCIHFRVDMAGTDTIDPDAMRPKLTGERFGQRRDTRLGRAVRRRPGRRILPEDEPTVTITPDCCGIITRAAARQQAKTPNRLTSRIRRKRSSLRSATGAPPPIPALQTMTSSRPRVLWMSKTASSTAAESLTSQTTPNMLSSSAYVDRLRVEPDHDRAVTEESLGDAAPDAPRGAGHDNDSLGRRCRGFRCHFTPSIRIATDRLP